MFSFPAPFTFALICAAISEKGLTDSSDEECFRAMANGLRGAEEELEPDELGGVADTFEAEGAAAVDSPATQHEDALADATSLPSAEAAVR